MIASAQCSPGQLSRSLRLITERLARELAHPTRVAPDWSPWHWTLARAVAAMHGVSPLLASELRWTGPPDWTCFVHDQRRHTVVRHQRIAALLEALHAATTESRISALALKGAALHGSGFYAPGDRPMADVDLLVRPADVPRTAAVLRSLGFRRSHTTWKETVFVPQTAKPPAGLGEHGGNDLKIELHERICERLPLRIVDVSEHVHPAANPGLNPYPSLAALLLHVMLHAAGAMTSKSLRLLHLHDLALISRRMRDADWDRFAAYADGQRLWWAYPALRMMLNYYAANVPDAVLERLARQCPGLLRLGARRHTLTRVSYSHPWVDAFPGAQWCRSPAQLAEYVAGRIRPTQQHVEYREIARRTETWAGHGEWATMSQSRRIVRFVTSRQTRPVALHAIGAAFERSAT